MAASLDIRHCPAPDLASFVAHVSPDDDASCITLSPRTIDALSATANDVVLVENTSLRRATPLIVRAGDASQENQVVILNEVASTNLQIQHQDRVNISRLSSLPSAVKVVVSPINISFEGRTEKLLKNSLDAYFRGNSRPVGVGDLFTAKHVDEGSVEFCVVSIEPAPYCIVCESTILHSDGKPITKADAKAWHTKASIPDTAHTRQAHQQKLRPQPLFNSQITPQTSGESRSQPDTPPHDPEGSKLHSEPPRVRPYSPPSPESAAFPPLQSVQTLPAIEHSLTASSTNTNDSYGLSLTQSQTVVRDFAPNIVVDKKRRKNPYRKITFRSMFLPHTVDPTYHMDLM